jgi:serpin B
MAYAGAKGKTAEEISATLQFTLPEEKILAGFNYLDLNLQDNTTSDFILKIVNTAWGQVGYSFEPVYLEKLAENYGAGLQLLDFKLKPESSRITINTWVADNTNNKVQNLIPQGLIDGNTKLVLTNAIYFLADWDNQFKKEFTTDQIFYLSPLDSVSVKMMLNEDVYSFGEFDDCKAINLFYKGKRISMTVFVPEIPIDQFCRGLDENKMEVISKGLKNESVLLSLPKFSYTYDVLLKDILVKLGMKTAFSTLADFSGISNESNLSVSEVIHKAFINVDEKGTEAAAATAVIMQDSAAPISKRMNVNKPFVFVIRDNQTGTVLFIGKVVNPI